MFSSVTEWLIWWVQINDNYLPRRCFTSTIHTVSRSINRTRVFPEFPAVWIANGMSGPVFTWIKIKRNWRQNICHWYNHPRVIQFLDAVWPFGRTLLDFLPDARWNSNYPCKGKRSPGKEDIADKVRLRLNIIYLTISIVYNVCITNFNDLFGNGLHLFH